MYIDYNMSNHSRNANLNDKNDSDDLMQSGRRSQSEHVLCTKDCLYSLVRQKDIW